MCMMQRMPRRDGDCHAELDLLPCNLTTKLGWIMLYLMSALVQSPPSLIREFSIGVGAYAHHQVLFVKVVVHA